MQTGFDVYLFFVGADEHLPASNVSVADQTAVRLALAVDEISDVVILVVDVDHVRITAAAQNRLDGTLIKYSPS